MIADAAQIVRAATPVRMTAPIRAAVLLGVPWRGGMLRAGQEMCRLLLAVLPAGSTVTLGVVAGHYDHARDLAGFVSPGLTIAEVEWTVSAEQSADGHPIANPRAAGVDLAEYDFWVVAHASLPAGVIDPAMRYAVYAPDFIPRYVPEIYGNASAPVWQQALRQFRIMRDARCVFATTPQTASDAVVFAGVPRSKTLAMPLFFDLPAAPAPEGKSMGAPFALWITNTTQHKNHLRALDALSLYYREMAGTLDVCLCGAMTLHFDPFRPRASQPHPYWVDVAMRLAADPILRRRVLLQGEVSADRYEVLMRDCAFLWHPASYDNGTFAALDAGRCGKRVVTSDYPQMRHIADYFGLAARFFDAYDPRDAARALKEAENDPSPPVSLCVPEGHAGHVLAAFREVVARVMAT